MRVYGSTQCGKLQDGDTSKDPSPMERQSPTTKVVRTAPNWVNAATFEPYYGKWVHCAQSETRDTASNAAPSIACLPSTPVS
ncbi:hypothetical protein SAMD00023353_0700920 [Rosellinia necatrix]|uniref:Uncharacterized protein n=1 Tax=Rosellinia necatrix TaxID=77044 RepID=A0A1S8A5V2_ROSNE|nr:hypothetical protein SAMD00023353_0700920 [Rosellinia necatrix]